jgi:hypothetical protein
VLASASSQRKRFWLVNANMKAIIGNPLANIARSSPLTPTVLAYNLATQAYSNLPRGVCSTGLTHTLSTTKRRYSFL